jgi:hypothetical protein
MVAEADSVMASKVHKEQTEQLVQVFKDQSLAKAFAANDDLTTQQAEACVQEQSHTAAATRLICCTCSRSTKELGYLAALCSPAGQLSQ